MNKMKFNWWGRKKKRIYLDYAAATPLSESVLKAMMPFLTNSWANASAIYSEGVETRRAIESARESVARTLRIRADEVTFTSGGTESNNLALVGSVEALHDSGVSYNEIEIISSEVEHPSVTEVLKLLVKKGCVVTYLEVNEVGLVEIDKFEKLLSPKTRLVSIAYANSETGVVQDINRIGRSIRAYEKANGLSIAFHTDASQAPLWLPCALDALSVDMMTLDAGKLFGPKGVGILAYRARAKLSPVIRGGGQEGGLRPGTENTASIVGVALALQEAQEKWEKRSSRVSAIRNRFLVRLLQIDGVILNGAKETRLANNINISIPYIDTEYVVIALDVAGIACSTKSACSGASGSGSAVVLNMTGDTDRAASTLRLSLGENTTWSDLKYTADVLEKHIEKTRAFNKTLK